MFAEETIVKTLESHGVKFVFGFPGETTLPFYGAVAKSGIKHIIARDERCAAHMADGYARATNKLGVCDAPAGMGTPFLCPALLEAFNSSIPLLAVVSSTPLAKRGKWPTSELDQEKLFAPITKKRFLIAREKDACKTTNEAILAALEPRTQPVLLEITYDVFRKKSSFKKLPTSKKKPWNVSREKLKKALSLLLKSSKPLIFVGGGIFLSNSCQELAKLSERLLVPVATTLTAKGAIPENHPFCLGVAGGKGRSYANDYFSQVDCVLVLGSKLGEKATLSWTLFNSKPKVIRVDVDNKELLNNVVPDIAFQSDLKFFLKEFLKLVESHAPKIDRSLDFYAQKNSWLNELEKTSIYSGDSVKPQLLIKTLQEISPKNVLVVADGSTASGWTGVCWQANGAGRKFIGCRGTGMIGFALPAAMGAKIGSPKDTVISFTGDGGFMFSCEELETAKRHSIPFVQIILNNQSLGLLQKHQQYVFGENTLPDFTKIDFCKLSESMGVKAFKIERKSELKEKLSQAIKLKEPVVLDVVIDKSELSPDFKNTLKRKGIRFG